MTPRRIALSLGAAAGGLLAGALLPAAVAAADQFVYEPDGTSFQELPSSQTGFLPSPITLPPFFDQQTGSEAFNIVFPNGNYYPDQLRGDVLITNLLGSTETQFDETVDNALDPGVPDVGSQITLWDLPGGFGNELILSNSVPMGLEDIVITPFGNLFF